MILKIEVGQIRWYINNKKKLNIYEIISLEKNKVFVKFLFNRSDKAMLSESSIKNDNHGWPPKLITRFLGH